MLSKIVCVRPVIPWLWFIFCLNSLNASCELSEGAGSVAIKALTKSDQSKQVIRVRVVVLMQAKCVFIILSSRYLLRLVYCICNTKYNDLVALPVSRVCIALLVLKDVKVNLVLSLVVSIPKMCFVYFTDHCLKIIVDANGGCTFSKASIVKVYGTGFCSSDVLSWKSNVCR